MSPPQSAEPAQSTTRRGPFARLMAALRGDRYMVNAYPPTVSPPQDPVSPRPEE